MTGWLDHILDAPQWVILLVVGLVVFAEDAIFVGFVIPGETAAILGGVAASRGHVPLGVMIAAVVAAAIVGDSVGYEVGRSVGPRLAETRVLARHRGRVEGAWAFLARRGGLAVLLGRWVAFFRAVMPALAGSARMPYARFLAFNAAGGVCWGVTVVLIGYLAGASYQRIEHRLGQGAAIAAAVLVLGALAVWHVRRRRLAAGREP